MSRLIAKTGRRRFTMGFQLPTIRKERMAKSCLMNNGSHQGAFVAPVPGGSRSVRRTGNGFVTAPVA